LKKSKHVYVHFSVTAAGPFYTRKYKTEKAADRAVKTAQRAGEQARKQVTRGY